jgi:hypothetical protein
LIRKTLTILFTVVCLVPALAFSQDRTSASKPPLLTFDDLQKNDSIAGSFRIVGYVIDIYKCPPCPPGAMCKPCIPDNLVVTDNIDEKDFSKIKRLRISTEKPEQFELKKKYTFTVKVKGKVPPGRPIQDVDLISFEPVKEVIN